MKFLKTIVGVHIAFFLASIIAIVTYGPVMGLFALSFKYSLWWIVLLPTVCNWTYFSFDYTISQIDRKFPMGKFPWI